MWRHVLIKKPVLSGSFMEVWFSPTMTGVPQVKGQRGRRHQAPSADAHTPEKMSNQPPSNENSWVGGPEGGMSEITLKNVLRVFSPQIFLIAFDSWRLRRPVKEAGVRLLMTDLGQTVFTDNRVCFSSPCRYCNSKMGQSGHAGQQNKINGLVCQSSVESTTGKGYEKNEPLRLMCGHSLTQDLLCPNHRAETVCEAPDRRQTLHLLYKSSVFLNTSSTRQKKSSYMAWPRDLPVTVLSVLTTEPPSPRGHRGTDDDSRLPGATSSCLQIHLGCTGDFSFYIHLHKRKKKQKKQKQSSFFVKLLRQYTWADS